MIQEFNAYLEAGKVVSKKTHFYLRWVNQLYKFHKKDSQSDLTEQEISEFLTQRSKHCQQWQVRQAGEAVQLYQFFRRRQRIQNQAAVATSETQWKMLADDMIRCIRLKHLSINTEKNYLSWLRSFYRFVGGKTPCELDSSHVKDYLTHLAAERNVAPSTQNQAFSAILFFYRYILQKEIDDLNGALRARRKKWLPVVLTKNEVRALITHIKGVNRLEARLIYGGGLRLRFCFY